MDNNYFETLKNAVQEPEQPNTNPVESSGMATLTVKVDIDCKIFCDGDFLDLFEANKVKKVTIPTGQHLMTIESEHFEGVSEDQVVDAAESGKNYLLLVNDLKLKEEAIIQKAEEEKRKAEEEGKREAEEKARQKAEEEAKSKAEEDARNIALEEEVRQKEEEEWIWREPYAALSNDNKTLTFYFDNQKMQRNGMDVGPFSAFERGAWQKNRMEITEVVFDDSFSQCDEIVSTAYWFYLLRSLKTIKGISFLNTKNVTDMTLMFGCCSSLRELDLRSFNTDNVTNMYGMFSGCSSLQELDLESFNTVNVTEMGQLFGECSSLKELNLYNFNTDNVTSMNGMFEKCSSLKELILRTFKTSNLKDMGAMFSGCSSLLSIDLSSFNTDNVTNMASMFRDCSSCLGIFLPNKIQHTDSYKKYKTVSLDGYMFNGCKAHIEYV